MKKSRIFVVISSSVLLLFFIGMVLFIGSIIFTKTSNLYPRINHDIDNSLFEKYNMNYNDFCKTYKIENININSTYLNKDITINYIYSKNCDTKKHNTVILAHGIMGNKYSMYPLAKFFLDKGYNVLTYDEVFKENSKEPHTSFGYYESFDLVDIISYVKNYTHDNKLVVYGTSLGANAAGIALDDYNMKNYVDYVILDSPMSSLSDEVENKISQKNKLLPSKILSFCGSIICKLRLGISFSEIDICTHTTNSKTPVLIFNSLGDTFTPDYMGCKIYKSLPSNVTKQIYTSEDSKHGEIFLDYPNEYEDAILDFID